VPPIRPHDRPIVKFILTNRFALLLFALTLLFFAGPVVELSGIRLALARTVFTVTFAAMMAAAVFAVSRSKTSLMFALLLAVPTFIADATRAWFGTPVSFLVDHTFSILFLGYVTLVILRLLFTEKTVTADLICASLCVYVLLGTLWAVVYSMVALIDPTAFSYPLLLESMQGDMTFGTESTSVTYYFSFVTMTTLGYGDIVPFSPAAKALASLQAVMGQLYLAVLVARLVGMHIAQSPRNKE
jgi:hypothetical protein